MTDAAVWAYGTPSTLAGDRLQDWRVVHARRADDRGRNLQQQYVRHRDTERESVCVCECVRVCACVC
jgi:hypothetical protein